jgi:hypothetical protein
VRPLNQAEAIALTKGLKARSPDLKLDPAVSRLVQPNYIHRPRWQGHHDCDVLGDLPTIGWVQGRAKLLAVPDEIAKQQSTPQWSPGEGTIASHPDAEAAADAVGSDGSIRSHLMCGVGHLLQANPAADEASAVAELRDMVEQRRAKIDLKKHGRKWIEVQNYFSPEEMGRFATWWIGRNRPQLKPGVVPKYALVKYPTTKLVRSGSKDVLADFLDEEE